MQTTLDEATQFNAVEMHAVRRPSGARWAASAAPTPADWGEPQPSAPSVPRTPRVAAEASRQGRGSGRGSGQVEAGGVDEELMFGIGGSMTTGRIMSAVPARFQSSEALSSDPSVEPVRGLLALRLDTHAHTRTHTHARTQVRGVLDRPLQDQKIEIDASPSMVTGTADPPAAGRATGPMRLSPLPPSARGLRANMQGVAAGATAASVQVGGSDGALPPAADSSAVDTFDNLVASQPPRARHGVQAELEPAGRDIDV